MSGKKRHSAAVCPTGPLVALPHKTKIFLQLLTKKLPRITDLVKTLYAVYDTGSVFTYFMRKCHFGGRN